MHEQLLPDRDCFEQILAAASLLQQIQRRAIYHGSRADADRFQLKDLVNIQQAIQTGTLSPEAAISSIALLALEMVPAQGAGVWLFAGDGFVYRAGAGTASADERLRNVVLSRLAESNQCANPQSSICAEPSLFNSLLVTPIYQGPAIAGALAVFSESENCFGERDQTSLRLLTGLLSHALDKAANARFKHTVSLERAVVLHVIETLVPSLEKLVETEEHRVGRVASVVDFTGANQEGSDAAPRNSEIVPPSTVVEHEKTAFELPIAYDTGEVREIWPVEPTPEAIMAVPMAVPAKSVKPSSSSTGATSALGTLPTQIERPAPTKEMKSIAIEESMEHPMTELLETSYSNFGAITRKSISSLRINLHSRYQQWRSLRSWSLKAVALVWNRLQRRGFKSKYLITSDSLVTKKRFAIVIALLAVLAFLVGKGKAPKLQPRDVKTATAAFVPPNRLSPARAPVTDGSHKRVTDPATAAALGELSRFEIPALMRRARYGDDAAAFLIGMAYETGQGMPQNCEKAAYWVKEAASGGGTAAQYNLGLRYRDGDGVAANPDESEKWLRKAAAGEYSEAQKALESLTSNQARAALLQP